MARFLSKETAPDATRMLYLAFKGGAAVARTEDLKTLLDLQYLAGLDIITVQHSLDFSLDDYEGHLRFAERWMEERGVDKPLMPVIQATDNKETSAKLLALVEKHEPSMIGFDLRGDSTIMLCEVLRSSRSGSRRSGSTRCRLRRRSGSGAGC